MPKGNFGRPNTHSAIGYGADVSKNLDMNFAAVGRVGPTVMMCAEVPVDVIPPVLPKPPIRKPSHKRSSTKKKKETRKTSTKRGRPKKKSTTSKKPQRKTTAKRKAQRKSSTKSKKTGKKGRKWAVEKGRPTVINGKVKYIPRDPKEHIYLGREGQVEDIPPKGLSNIQEVAGILREIDEDYRKLPLDINTKRQIINARLNHLKAAVCQTQKGELGEKQKKDFAVKLINEARKHYGFNPLKPTCTKELPTPKQIAAAKKNIKKAQQAWIEKHKM